MWWEFVHESEWLYGVVVSMFDFDGWRELIECKIATMPEVVTLLVPGDD